ASYSSRLLTYSFRRCAAPALPHLHSFPTRRSSDLSGHQRIRRRPCEEAARRGRLGGRIGRHPDQGRSEARTAVPHRRRRAASSRSEEHTSELQSRFDLVCRLLLEKKKYIKLVCIDE